MPPDPTDMAESVERVEEMDSDESFRCKAAEDLLGGKAGEVREECFRGGKAGGGGFFGAIFVMVAGRRM